MRQLVQVVFINSERINKYLIITVKFHVVNTPEGGCILILLATFHPKVDPFNLPCQSGNIVIAKREV